MKTSNYCVSRKDKYQRLIPTGYKVALGCNNLKLKTQNMLAVSSGGCIIHHLLGKMIQWLFHQILDNDVYTIKPKPLDVFCCTALMAPRKILSLREFLIWVKYGCASWGLEMISPGWSCRGSDCPIYLCRDSKQCGCSILAFDASQIMRHSIWKKRK